MQPVLFLLLPAVIGVIVYLFIYFRTANARITGEYDPEKNSKMPAPSSALSVLWKIAVVVCFIILFIKLNYIEHDITYINNDITKIYNRLENLQYHIIPQLEDEIYAQNSLFTKHGFRVLSTNWDKMQTEIEYYVVPKEMSESGSVSLYFDGREYPMVKRGTEWTASVSIGIFDSVCHENGASIIEHGNVRNQTWTDEIIISKELYQFNRTNVESTYKKGNLQLSGAYELVFPTDMNAKDVFLTITLGNTVWKKAELTKQGDSTYRSEVNDIIPCKVGDSITFTISWSFGNGMRGEKELSGGIINDTSDSIIFVGPDSLFPFDIYDKDGNKIH